MDRGRPQLQPAPERSGSLSYTLKDTVWYLKEIPQLEVLEETGDGTGRQSQQTQLLSPSSQQGLWSLQDALADMGCVFIHFNGEAGKCILEAHCLCGIKRMRSQWGKKSIFHEGQLKK